MVKNYKNMRKTINYIGWGTEEAKHKYQELNLEEESMIKDHILKKCLWFYKCEDIFHKYLIISSSILIESEQLAYCNKVNVNDSKLKGFDFDLKETLKNYKEIKDIELGLLLSNHNDNNNLNSDLCFVFSQII